MNGLDWGSASVATLSLTAAVFVLAGLVKGVVGLGLPTVSMALLALWMTPAEAAALLIVPSLVTNVWQMRPFGGALALARRLWPLLLAACVGTALGALAGGLRAGAWAHTALGAALVAYALWSLAGARLAIRPAQEGVWGAVVGAVTGAITAATGVFAVPAVPYLQALGLQRDALVQAMGLSFTVSTLALAAGLAWQTGWAAPMAGWSTLLLVPALLGMALGQWLRRRLSPERFRICLMASLLVLGVYMIVA